MKTQNGVNIIIILTLASLSAYKVFGQAKSKQITRQELLWYGYFNTIEFYEKLFLTTEIQERRFFNPYRQHQFLMRSHLHYKIGSGWDAASGFTYFLQSPQDPYSKSKLKIPELRPHIEFNFKQNVGKLGISHRYKTEWRFFRNTINGELSDGYNNYFRFRYRIGIEYPLFKKKEGVQCLKLKANDEIHFNAGNSIVKNVFDQNRIYLGLNYQINQNISVEAGYLNWFQERTSGDQFYCRNIIRFTFFHKIIILKKSEYNE